MLNFNFFGRAYKHFNRYTEIIGILRMYGFNDILEALKVKSKFEFIKREDDIPKDLKHLNQWIKFRLALEELGPTFIKLGQLLSNRPDIFPAELISELEKLQDNVRPITFTEVKEVIEKELGRPLETIFMTLDESPLAAASIAQVHKGILFDGTPVAIKVQRPGIEAKIQTDLEIALNMVQVAENYNEEVPKMQLPGIINQFKKIINLELHFINEAINMERFREDFRKDPRIYVPKVYREYSNDKVLTMELIDGIKVTDPDALMREGISSKQIADWGVDAFFDQVFKAGFFHADPHAGNLVVMKEITKDETNPGIEHVSARICYLDFGMMGVVLDRDKENLGSIFIGIEEEDTNRVVRGFQKLGGRAPIDDTRQLEFQIKELIDYYNLFKINQVSLAQLLALFRKIIVDNNVQVHPDFFLLLRAMSLAEGLGRQLDPEFNAFAQLNPHLNELMRSKMNPVDLLRTGYLTSFDVLNMLKKLPFDAEEIIDKLKKGEMHIEFEHKGLEPFMNTIDASSNRISFAIVLSALIIGSSLIVHSGIPPKFYNIPVIGLIGYLLAGIVGIWLLFSIIRSGKLRYKNDARKYRPKKF